MSGHFFMKTNYAVKIVCIKFQKNKQRKKTTMRQTNFTINIRG